MKKLIGFIILIGVFCNSETYCQPQISWNRCLGGSSYDYATSACLAGDGSIVVAGTTYSHDGDFSDNHGYIDGWIAKIINIESGSKVVWKHCIGDTLNDEINRIIATTDGGFITIGSTWFMHDTSILSHGNFDVWIVKMNSKGEKEWQRCLGGSGLEQGISMITCTDGGYILLGETKSTDGDLLGTSAGLLWLIKISETGKTEWQKRYDGSRAIDIIQTVDNGYLLTGSTNDTSLHTIEDGLLIKIDSIGNVQWQRSYGGSKDDYFIKILPEPNGGYIGTLSVQSTDGDVIGSHDSTNVFGYGDIWVVRLNDTGNIIWQHCFGGRWADYGMSFMRTNDGKYIISGSTNSDNDDIVGTHNAGFSGMGAFIYDWWVFKFDTTGKVLWQKCLGGSQDDILYSAFMLNNKTMVTVGETSSTDGNITSNNGFADADQALIMKLVLTDAGVTEKTLRSEIGSSLVTGSSLRIKTISGVNSISLFDILGKEVLHKEVSATNGQGVIVDISKLPAGTYLVKMRSNSGVSVQKILKQ